jgi:hypothetical protein
VVAFPGIFSRDGNFFRSYTPVEQFALFAGAYFNRVNGGILPLALLCKKSGFSNKTLHLTKVHGLIYEICWYYTYGVMAELYLSVVCFE